MTPPTPASPLPRLRWSLLAGLLLMATGCSSTPYAVKSADSAALNHVVLISLGDPDLAAACAEDCRIRLASIDTVRTIWVGTPVDTGRDAVDGDYEVGLCVGFDSADDLQSYLADPIHLDLVERWRPEATRFRIFDVGGPELRR